MQERYGSQLGKKLQPKKGMDFGWGRAGNTTLTSWVLDKGNYLDS